MKKQTGAKQQSRFQLTSLAALMLAVLFMAIGFAAYAQTLRITGTANLGGALWKVEWDTQSFQQLENSQAVAQKSFTGTDFSFSCILPEPGTKCKFRINAVNRGTYDAKLNSVTMSEPAADYLKYTITYLDHAGNELNFEHSSSSITDNAGTGIITLPKLTGNTPVAHSVIVEVDFVTPENAADLPTDETEPTEFTASFGYSQL